MGQMVFILHLEKYSASYVLCWQSYQTYDASLLGYLGINSQQVWDILNYSNWNPTLDSDFARFFYMCYCITLVCVLLIIKLNKLAVCFTLDMNDLLQKHNLSQDLWGGQMILSFHTRYIYCISGLLKTRHYQVTTI